MMPHLSLRDAVRQTSDKLALYSVCCRLSSIQSDDNMSPGRCLCHCIIEIHSQLTNNRVLVQYYVHTPTTGESTELQHSQRQHITSHLGPHAVEVAPMRDKQVCLLSFFDHSRLMILCRHCMSLRDRNQLVSG